jgi:hypothetical protein
VTQIQTDRRPTHPLSFSSRRIKKILFFLRTKNHCTPNIEQSAMTSQASVVQPAMILDHRTINTEQSATILVYKVSTKEKIIFVSLGNFIFILLQGLRQLILLKTKDRFTSLMVIGVTKIMCNTWDITVPTKMIIQSFLPFMKVL